MRIIEKIKIVFLVWTLLLVLAAIAGVRCVIINEYVEHGLIFCAVSNYIADVHWISFVFVSITLAVTLLSILFLVITGDGYRSLTASIKICLFLIIAYIFVVFYDTRAWLPELHTTRGLIYNAVILLAISGIIYFVPLPVRSLYSMLNRVKSRVPIGIALMLYILPLSYWAQVRKEKAAGYNVLFITVDTLRYRNLSMSGYHRKTSENMDAFARRCINFKSAYSQSSFTPPSHASMFTSRIVSNLKLYGRNELDDSAITMAEIFANEGLSTAAFVNLALLSRQNLGQGFQTKVESFLTLRNCLTERALYKKKQFSFSEEEKSSFFSGWEINEMFLEWLRDKGDSPFFVWLHYWDVHRPYARDQRYESVFSESRIVNRRIGRNMKHYNLRRKNIEELGLTENDLNYICDRYDAGIYTFDLVFKDLIEGLKKLGLFDRTVIVMTSDHGESLLERDEMYFTHDPYLYNEVINVPLIIKLPDDQKTLEINEPVMLVDLMPTLLRLFGISNKYHIESDGMSLDLSGATENLGSSREIVSECFGWRHKRAIIIDDIKYIYDFEKSDFEVYDLREGEKEQASIPQEELAVFYGKVMKNYKNDMAAVAEDEEMDANEYEMLKSLGYIEQ